MDMWSKYLWQRSCCIDGTNTRIIYSFLGCWSCWRWLSLCGLWCEKKLHLVDQHTFFCSGRDEKTWIQGDASFPWCVIVPSKYWFYRSKGCSWKSKFMTAMMTIWLYSAGMIFACLIVDLGTVLTIMIDHLLC